MRTGPPLYAEVQAWLDEDWEIALGDRVEAFWGKRILVTGAAGFLGFGFLHLFSYLNRNAPPCGQLSIVAADNYIRGCPRWLIDLAATSKDLRLVPQDITKPWQHSEEGRFDYIIHAASIASPKVYRKNPLETLDTNVSGLRHMLGTGQSGWV